MSARMPLVAGGWIRVPRAEGNVGLDGLASSGERYFNDLTVDEAVRLIAELQQVVFDQLAVRP